MFPHVSRLQSLEVQLGCSDLVPNPILGLKRLSGNPDSKPGPPGRSKIVVLANLANQFAAAAVGCPAALFQVRAGVKQRRSVAAVVLVPSLASW